MRWRDENIRTTNAYRIWADADTPSAWRAYQDAFDREHEALVRYTELAVRAGDLSQGASDHSAADAPAERTVPGPPPRRLPERDTTGAGGCRTSPAHAGRVRPCPPDKIFHHPPRPCAPREHPLAGNQTWR